MTKRKRRRARPWKQKPALSWNLRADPYNKFLDGIEELMRDDTKSREKVRSLLGAARSRARNKGIPFDLRRDDELSIQAVLDRGLCEMTGRPLVVGSGPFAPTLDRINPAKGYVRGNVRVICRLMNFALGSWGEDLLREVIGEWLPTPPNRPPYSVFDAYYLSGNRLAQFD